MAPITDIVLTDAQIRYAGRKLLEYRPLPAAAQFHASLAKNRWFIGGNRCLGGEQEIYDPVAGKYRRVDSIKGPWHVLAWDGTKLVTSEASEPFTKPAQWILDVGLSSGEHIACSGTHQVLTLDGYQPLGVMRSGCELFRPVSTLGSGQKVPHVDAHRLFGTPSDCPDGYIAGPSSHDEPLRQAIEGDRASFLPRGYARTRTRFVAYALSDDQGGTPKHSRVCRLSGLPSSQDAPSHFEGQFSGTGCRASCTPSGSTLLTRPTVDRSKLGSRPRQSTPGSVRQGSPNISASAHGYESAIDVPCSCSPIPICGTIAITSLEVKRKDVVWDFEVPEYHNYLAAGVISHNSGKSEANIGWDLCRFALNIHPVRVAPPKAIIWAATDSWPMVGKLLWEEKIQAYIPPGRIKKIIWHNQGAGIPNEVRLSNGTKIEFKAYEQGRDAFQGRAIDAFYGDEQCPYDSEGIWQEIQARLMDRNGFTAQSMTPIRFQPWLEQRIRSLPPTDAVFYADLEDNRKSRGGHVDDAEIDMLIAQWPPEIQATRVKGRFAAFLGAVFKTFSREVHVCAPFKVPPDWPKWRSIDFGFANPFVCLWLTRDPDKHWYVYAEHYQAQESIAFHAERIKGLSGKERYRCTWADHDAQDRYELEKQGIKTVAAKKDVHAGIETIQACLKIQPDCRPRLQVFNTCPHTIEEIQGYRWAEGGENKDAKDEPLKVRDHAVDCVRYGLLGAEGGYYFTESELS